MTLLGSHRFDFLFVEVSCGLSHPFLIYGGTLGTTLKTIKTQNKKILRMRSNQHCQ